MREMKKVCFVKYDMRVTGGGERVCANLANALSDKYEVHVVSICSEKDESFYSLKERVIYSVLIRGNGRIRDTLPKGIRALHRYLIDNEIDVVLAVGVSVNPFVMLAAKGTECKTISCEHLNCISEYENDISQRFCRYLGAKNADRIVTLTEKDRDAYIEKYRLSPDNVDCIYNWVDECLLSDESEYNPKAQKILSVVRIIPIKGVENSIDVAKRIYNKYPDWQWHIYGAGEEEYVKKLQGMINEYGLADFLVLKGKVSNMYERYSDYGLFVLTSYCEGLPMVLIESKAKRIPCISFDCLTGPRDIIRDGDDGYLIPVDDLETLCDKLELCMANEDLRKRLSDNAYDNIELFSQKTIVDKWTKLIGD